MEQDPSSVEELPTAKARHVQNARPLPQTFSAPIATTTDPALRAKSPAWSSPSLPHLLRLWSNDFVADARATARHIRSWWGPLINDLRREFHQLRNRASRLPSDPRWKHIRDRAASASQTSWTSLKAAMPRWLAKSLGTRQPNAHKHTQTTLASRAKRRPAILSLRRWLHKPLTTQQKRSARNQRRSAN